MAAAQKYFALYAAGLWSAVYPLIDPAQRAQIPEALYVGAHQGCPDPISGVTRQVTNPVLAGNTAVITVSASGVGSALGSAQDTMVYVNGQWYAHIDPATVQIYAGHAVDQVVATLKAQGYCANS